MSLFGEVVSSMHHKAFRMYQVLNNSVVPLITQSAKCDINFVRKGHHLLAHTVWQ